MSERAPRGILYCIDAYGRTAVGDSGFIVCNGPAFSPSGETMYFSDSAGGRLLAYSLDRETGGVSEPRLLVQFDKDAGMPDGLCVDSVGMIYCAHYGGGRVTRSGPDGEHLETLALPARNVTSCCLGGPDLNILFVTTAENAGAHHLDGALFATKVSVAGLPEPIYSGNILANVGSLA
jgi:sugar lactone lactonase YvrE